MIVSAWNLLDSVFSAFVTVWCTALFIVCLYMLVCRYHAYFVWAPWRIETANQRGGSEWEPIKILLKRDRGFKKMNTASNTHLRLTTQVDQDHAATGVLLALGTNKQLHRPENAAEHQTRASLTYTSQAGEHHRSDQSCWWNLEIST
jgi:hypothetical protein